MSCGHAKKEVRVGRGRTGGTVPCMRGDRERKGVFLCLGACVICEGCEYNGTVGKCQ